MGDGTESFVAAVGQRVRQTREQSGMTRKTLSDVSGVSQRYLAQLEAGKGNVSLALLHKVSRALKCHPVHMLDVEPGLDGLGSFARKFGNASESQRAAALRALEAECPAPMAKRRIALIGLRGAGKSTLGQLISLEIGCPFVELNDLIEEQCAMPIGEVIALYGVDGYRRLERSALEAANKRPEPFVLAVGGGIVSDAETFNLLLEAYFTIWLKAAPHEHMDRVRAQGDERPMANNPRAMDELRSLLQSRETLYARADRIVDTSGVSVDDSLNDLQSTIADLDLAR